MFEVTPGVWRIGCGDRYMYDYEDPLILVAPGKDDKDKGFMWRLDYMDGDHTAFTINNVETGNYSSAAPPNEMAIQIGRKTKWVITSAGRGRFHIRWPNENMYWTVIPERGAAPVRLKELAGKPEQAWKFERVGYHEVEYQECRSIQ